MYALQIILKCLYTKDWKAQSDTVKDADADQPRGAECEPS